MFTFPKDFLWGVATSAGQIEGGACEDGRSPSIWDTFSAIPGKIAGGDTPAVACDYYHRYPEQLALIKELGFQSHRFSFSWSRILPEGTGKPNQKGLDFYKRAIDEMLRLGLTPNATMYHWDLPQALDDRGGFLNRDIVSWFGEYADVLLQNFGDVVPLWTTFNEPIATYVGYGPGWFAPGRTGGERDGRIANHHLLLAHGEAVRRFRAHFGEDDTHKIGIVVDLWHHHPARPDNADDIRLAELENEKAYRSYLHPLFKGAYSPALLEFMKQNNAMPDIREGDMASIAEPLDFFGLNCYNRVVDCADGAQAARQNVEHAGGNYMDNGMEYYPKAIYDALHILTDDYGLQIPIYITENGTQGIDEQPVTENGETVLHDPMRIRYYQGFLEWLGKALAEGIDVRGYYAWTLLDNFEWSAGYSFRFGMVHTPVGGGSYVLKDSAKWWRQFLKSPQK